MTLRATAVRCLAAGFFSAVTATAQVKLTSKSPFDSVAAAGAPAATSNAPLEFLGYIEIGQGPQFRLHDPAGKKSAWVGLNERNDELGVLVKQHNRGENESLTVEHRGATHTLAIRKAKVASGGPVPAGIPPPAVAPAPNVIPAVTQSVVVNPTPADETKRLEAVAAEVARRRALREQAVTTVNQQAVQPR